MDKLLILGRVQTIKNNYALAQAGIALLALPDARARLDEVFSLLKEHPETQAIRYIDYVFEHNGRLKLATGQFRNAVLRNCMKELFEQVKLYGRKTNQKQVMDKLLILGRVQTIKNNYALAQAGIALLALPDARARLDEVFSLLKEHPETQAIRYIDYVFEHNGRLKLATGQFRNAVLRNCMKELFEQVKLYGRKTNQKQVIEAAPWFQFLRIVRNCLSHDMKLQFRSYDLKQLPISWSGLTIDESMQNSQLPMREFLSREKALELVDAVINYLETKCA